jgi:PTS system galactitol-specific IIB component
LGKKILVACGTALATSKVIAKKIEAIASEEGLSCSTVECKADKIPEKIREENPNLLVTTYQIEEKVGIPVINGRSFLTGINFEQTREKLIDLLKD